MTKWGEAASFAGAVRRQQRLADLINELSEERARLRADGASHQQLREFDRLAYVRRHSIEKEP